MTKNTWDISIDPSSSVSKIHNLKEVWKYRDLLVLFVKRDIISFYKQTILGPVWFFIQPIFTTAVFTLIGMLAALETTNDTPGPIFYLSGIVMWNYFAETLNKTAETFIQNRGIFSKVYFPRLIIPLSLVASHLVKFFIQCILIVAFYIYFAIKGPVHPGPYLALFPILVILIAMLGMGMGLIVSALTTKYRDLKFLVKFSIDLVKYVSPIIFPLSSEMVTGKFELLIAANPMSSIIELFRVGLFDAEVEPNLWWYFLYTCVFATGILYLGFHIFSRVEKRFIDTV